VDKFHKTETLSKKLRKMCLCQRL